MKLPSLARPRILSLLVAVTVTASTLVAVDVSSARADETQPFAASQAADPTSTDPTSADPAGTDPAGTDPADTNPASSEPVIDPAPTTDPATGDPTTDPTPVTDPDPTTDPTPVTDPDPTTDPTPVTDPDPTTDPTPVTITMHGPSTITGTFAVGQTLTAVPAAWDDGVTLNYVWLRDGTAGVPGNGDTGASRTGQSYVITADDLGRDVSVATTGTKDGATPVREVTYSFIRTAPGSLTSSVPTISTVSGALPTVSQWLTVNVGTWSPQPSFSYQWFRNGAAIVGATKATYPTLVGDAGASITVGVSGTLPGYTTVTRNSAAIVPTLNAFRMSPAPVLPARVSVDQNLVVTPAGWAPSDAAFAYQWLLDGRPVAGATSAVFRVPATALGHALSVRVIASKPGYTPVTRTSVSVRPVAATFVTAPTPAITGRVQLGQRISVNRGSWLPEATSYSYSWQRNGVAIPGATATSYVITTSDSLKKITVTVTAHRVGWVTTARTSGAVTVPLASIPSAPTPKISGSTKSGGTLTASLGTWTAGVSVSVQWRRNNVAISGATGRTYRVTASDLGKTLTVVATGRKAGYTTLVRGSAGVAIPKPAPPAAPKPAPAKTYIIPGAFCPDASVGKLGTAANGKQYRCGGHGADRNGHYHWNTL